MQKIRLRDFIIFFLLCFTNTFVFAQTNLALQGTASASSNRQPASFAIDNNNSSRWESVHGVDPSWIKIDLGSSRNLSSVQIVWEAANAATYRVQGSNDNTRWTTLASFSGGAFGGRTDNHKISGAYRYVRMYGIARSKRSDGRAWGYSIHEFRIFGEQGFAHPGVLLNKAQLDFVKENIASNREPWKSAYAKLLNSGGSTKTARRNISYRFASLNYHPAPVAVVKCTASYGEKLNYVSEGCTEQTDDALAAYTHALMWYYTGQEAHAMKAIEIMDAWSSTLTEILFDQPRSAENRQIYENGKLQAGWGAQLFTRSAEIIRHTYSGWSPQNVQSMETHLKQVYLPLVESGWTGGANWFATFAEAMINIAVFTNDKALFNKATAYWEAKIPSIIYMPSDGVTPIPPSSGYNTANKMWIYWWKPQRYIPGLETETCRDLGHTMMGLGALINVAETARIQGVDLYGKQKDRIIAAYELQSNYTTQLLNAMQAQGKTAPQLTQAGWIPTNNWACDVFKDGGSSAWHGFELAYNHLNGRLGVDMPQT
ncbi:MAG: hypothetical protein EOO68_15250, partial [Moraxellaceae bacterium]